MSPQDHIKHKNEQDQRFEISFLHRVSLSGFSSSTLFLVDTISAMAARASAQLLFLEDHLIHDEENRFSPEILESMIASIRMEVLDIQQAARAYHDAILRSHKP